jgi:fimbrial chaperone protein
MRGTFVRGLLLASALLASTVPSNAYDLKPILIQLAPSGTGAAQSMIITNTHDEPIAIEIKAYKRSQNLDGSDSREPEENDLIISPPQMVIAPKSSQSIKVRWVGSATVDRELAYRIVTSQLPIKFKSASQGEVNAQLSMNYSYEAALYILPQNAVRNARLVSLTPVQDAAGQQQMEVRIASEGNSRAILRNPTLIVKSKSGGEALSLNGEAAKELSNLNILAGAERIVRIPWPTTMPFGPVEGELQTEYMVLR